MDVCGLVLCASTTQVPRELRERAIREVRSTGRPVAHAARDLGIHKDALRSWVRQAEADTGERDELKDLRREVAGRCPRGARVRPLGGLRSCPASSSRQLWAARVRRGGLSGGRTSSFRTSAAVSLRSTARRTGIWEVRPCRRSGFRTPRLAPGLRLRPAPLLGRQPLARRVRTALTPRLAPLLHPPDRPWNSAATSAVRSPRSNRSAASSRTRSRSACSSGVQPPPSACRIEPSPARALMSST